MPDGTFAKVEFDSWMQRSLILMIPWKASGIKTGLPVGSIATPEEVDAANKAAAHKYTHGYLLIHWEETSFRLLIMAMKGNTKYGVWLISKVICVV